MWSWPDEAGGCGQEGPSRGDYSALEVGDLWHVRTRAELSVAGAAGREAAGRGQSRTPWPDQDGAPEAVSQGPGLVPEGPGSPGRFPLGVAGPGPPPGTPPRLPEEQGLGLETGSLRGWEAGEPEPGPASPALVLSLLCAPVTPATLQGGAGSC